MPEAQNILSGREVFRLRDTEGLPLSIIFERCHARGLVIDWPGFIDAARAHRWLDARIVSAVEEAIADAAMPPEYRAEVSRRMVAYMSARTAA